MVVGAGSVVVVVEVVAGTKVAPGTKTGSTRNVTVWGALKNSPSDTAYAKEADVSPLWWVKITSSPTTRTVPPVASSSTTTVRLSPSGSDASSTSALSEPDPGRRSTTVDPSSRSNVWASAVGGWLRSGVGSATVVVETTAWVVVVVGSGSPSVNANSSETIGGAAVGGSSATPPDATTTPVAAVTTAAAVATTLEITGVTVEPIGRLRRPGRPATHASGPVARRRSPNPMFRKARATSGSNWLPALLAISWRATSGGSGFL